MRREELLLIMLAQRTVARLIPTDRVARWSMRASIACRTQLARPVARAGDSPRDRIKTGLGPTFPVASCAPRDIHNSAAGEAVGP